MRGKVQEHWVDEHGKAGNLFETDFKYKNFFWQVFKLDGSDDCFLFILAHNWLTWSFWSSLNGEQAFLDSASAGQSCPAHSRNARNETEGFNNWRFNKLAGNEVEAHGDVGGDAGQGGVVIRCTVHDN